MQFLTTKKYRKLRLTIIALLSASLPIFFTLASEQAVMANSNRLPRPEVQAIANVKLFEQQIAQATGQESAINPAQWMEQAASYIQDKKLKDLAIPSTHDSAMYDTVSTYNRPVNDAFAPDVDSDFTKLGSFIGVAEKWSKTQDKSIYEQLTDGIRALDLRTCVEKNGTFRTCHGLYGPKMEDVLRDVKRFANEHPKEIIILGFNRFSETAPGKMSNEKHDLLIAKIKSELANNLVDTSAMSPSVTVKNIWENQKGRSVVVIYKYPDTYTNRTFWGGDRTYSSWKDTWDMKDKKESLEQKLATASTSDTLLHFSGEVTPDAKLIGLAALPGYPSSLKELAEQTNPVMLGWIKNEWANKRLNLISIDFYNQTCLVRLTHWLNGIPNVQLSGCNIGTNTSWASLKGSKPCPEGFRDDGLFCAKPNPVVYPRPSYPWKFGDKLNDSGMFKRCEKQHGSGSCQKLGAIVYGKCKAGYTPDKPGLSCVVSCPSGMTDIGVSCKK